MNSHDRRVVFYASLAHGLSHLFELIFAGVLLKIGQDLGAGLSALGVLATVYALTFGGSALPAGFLTDRLGARRLIALCFLGGGIAAALVGVSSSLEMLGVALGFLGLWVGLYHPAGFTFITQHVRLRGQALGWHGIAGSLGLAVSPLLAATLASLAGWRAAYLSVVPAALALGALFHFARFQESQGVAPERAQAEAGAAEHLSLAPLIILFCFVAIGGFLYRGTITFLPSFLATEAQFRLFDIDAVALAGALTTMALLVGMAGQYLGGTLSDRVQAERLLFLVPLGVVPSLLLMGLTTSWLLLPAVLVYLFFTFFQAPLTTVLLAKYTPSHLRGRGYGFQFFFTFGPGSFAAVVAGLLAESMGMGRVFLVLGLLGFSMLALAGLLLYRARGLAPALRVTSL